MARQHRSVLSNSTEKTKNMLHVLLLVDKYNLQIRTKSHAESLIPLS